MNQRVARSIRLSPLLIPLVVIFSTGICMAVLQSLGFFLPFSGGNDVSEGSRLNLNIFAAYRALFSSSWFYADLLFSLYAAFTSASVAVVAGTAIAYLVWRMPRRFQQMTILSKIPLILPHIAVAFIVLMFFNRTGYLSSITTALGITTDAADFPPLLFGGGGVGIILAYIYKETPFAMLLVAAVLKRFDFRRVETARMFGAGRFTVFFRVVFPHLLPVLHTSFIILFLYSFGAFDIPFMLGESRPMMLSIQVYNLYFKRDLANRPQAMAILVIMFLFSILFIYLYTRLSERLEITGRKL
jgi:putative spermidine/putrescine transport system permease protein